MQILTAPHPVLKEVAAPIASHEFQEVGRLIPKMYDMMKKSRGIGLAAPQVGISKRFLIIDIEGETDGLLVMVNPVITLHGKTGKKDHEGCLSLPGGTAPMERHEDIRVSYFDEHGTQHGLEDKGLLARCIQHEIDHLDGVLYIDRVNAYHRTRVMDKVRKITGQK